MTQAGLTSEYVTDIKRQAGLSYNDQIKDAKQDAFPMTIAKLDDLLKRIERMKG